MQKIYPNLTIKQIQNRINEAVEMFLDRQKTDLLKFLVDIK